MADIDVRPPSDRADARDAAVAHNRAWRRAYDGLLPAAVLAEFDPDPDEETVDSWHEGLAEAECGLVADDGDRVVGYAVFRWENTKSFVGPDEAGLKEIYVHPDWWGEGVGTALLAAGIDHLPRNCRGLKLEVFADNDRGRGFYEARGFERVDTVEVEVADEFYEAAVYARSLG